MAFFLLFVGFGTLEMLFVPRIFCLVLDHEGLTLRLCTGSTGRENYQNRKKHDAANKESSEYMFLHEFGIFSKNKLNQNIIYLNEI